MLSKKLPSCACISVLSKVAVPTTLGTLIAFAVKIPNITKTANDLKKAIPTVQNFMNDLSQSQNQENNIAETDCDQNNLDEQTVIDEEV